MSATRRHINNVAILVLSLAMLLAALMLLEYDIAKIRKPYVGWIPTNPWIDMPLAGFTVFLGILNLAMLILIYRKGLDNRLWLWGSVVVGWLSLAILALVLGPRFLPILSP